MAKKQKPAAPTAAGLYTQLEDHYYNFMDELDEALPVYKWFVDPIENTGTQSMPVFALILLVLVGAVAWMAMANSTPHVGNLVVQVNYADGQPVNGALVTVTHLGNYLGSSRSVGGEAVVSAVPIGLPLVINVEAKNSPAKLVDVEKFNPSSPVVISLSVQAPVAQPVVLPGSSNAVSPDLLSDALSDPNGFKMPPGGLGELPK